MTAAQYARPATLTIQKLDFTGGPDGSVPEPLKAEVLAAVRKDGLVVVQGFPRDGGALVKFGRAFGELEPADPFKEKQSADDPDDWLGHTKAHKKKTWGQKLALHTAAAHAQLEPKLHMMLMLDKGMDNPDLSADNGQSLLVRVEDVIDRLTADVGSEADAVIEALLSTPVSTGFPFPDVPRDEPILTRTDDGAWRFRYWIRLLEYAERGERSAAQLDAFRAFDAALNAAVFDLVLENGDLIVVDNQRVAHGRRPFPKEIPNAAGELVPTTRRIYNVHVFCEI